MRCRVSHIAIPYSKPVMGCFVQAELIPLYLDVPLYLDPLDPLVGSEVKIRLNSFIRFLTITRAFTVNRSVSGSYCTHGIASSTTTVFILLFLGGANQVAFSKAKDFCLISADLWGCGGTGKPMDFKYVPSGLVHGVVDIPDIEGIQTAIRIHHHHW